MACSGSNSVHLTSQHELKFRSIKIVHWMKPFLCNGNANTESCKIKFQFRLLVDKDQYGNLVNIRTLLVKPRGRKIEKNPSSITSCLLFLKDLVNVSQVKCAQSANILSCWASSTVIEEGQPSYSKGSCCLWWVIINHRL